MPFTHRLRYLSLIPIVTFLTLQLLFPDALDSARQNLQSWYHKVYVQDMELLDPLPRSETPLIISAVTHWSHFEKIAKIAVVLAKLGYPITLITGRIFEKETLSLHPSIKFHPLQGGADKMTEEEYATYASFPPGSEEAELFIQKVVLVNGTPATHNTLQEVFQDFKGRYGDKKPLLSFYDLPVVGHLPILLGAPGIRPDATLGISCHPITMDSNDTYPPHIDKVPETGPDAKAIHWKAYQDRHDDFRIRELDLAWWAKLREMGANQDVYPSLLHAMAALPDHLLTLGAPEFEWPRTDLRPNVRYFGALNTKETEPLKPKNLPLWWDDVVKAKQKGKKIVALSQGTIEANLNDLLIPTLDALKDRDDVLVVASTVVVEPDEVPELALPRNARATKFVPYDLLLPLTDVLVNNGGYGAVITALTYGIPMVVAGAGQDKIRTNNIVQWSGVGINLGTRTPEVGVIQTGVDKVLNNNTYKTRAMDMSKNLEKYDLGTVFDDVIQGIVRNWTMSRLSQV